MADAPDPVEHFFAQPWSDGLPVVVPTEERLSDMLGDHTPDALIGHVPPANHPATFEAVALHAVMAGCKPEYFPALLCALRCILDPGFNMNGIQATMNPAGPLIVMNGPYPREIGVHGGTGCLGPGFRANATIGRALRLMLLNLGGGVPGVVDMSTFGSPSKFTYCLRENEEISPWPSLAEERGFGEDENVVTACAGESPRVALDDSSDHPDGVLTTIASTIATMGTRHTYSPVGLTVIMGPEHAQLLADHGFSRDDAKRGLQERARLPVGLLKRGGRYRGKEKSEWPGWVDHDDDDCMAPMIREPEDVTLLVAGGLPGPSSFIIPGWNNTNRPVSKAFAVE